MYNAVYDTYMVYDKIKAASYVRVSTQDQSCDLQKAELTAFAAQRGFELFRTFEDKATGTNGNRAQLKELLTSARAGEFKVLLVWKMDRLFRSLKDLILTLQELQELGISFISLKDNIDLTTSTGRLMMQIVGAFAEFEASVIKERVRAGLRNAKAKGKQLGRPRQRDDEKIHALRAQGLTIRAIAKTLGISKGAVQVSLDVLKTRVSTEFQKSSTCDFNIKYSSDPHSDRVENLAD